MKTLLIPTNFSDLSRHAMDYAMKLYCKEKLRLILLNSFEQPKTGRSIPLSLIEIMKRNSEKGLLEDKLRLQENFPDRDFEIVIKSAQGHVASSIKSILEDYNVDLIVMGSKGDMEFMDIFIESETARVIRQIDHPMLIVPPIAEFKSLDRIILTTDLKPISDPSILGELNALCTLCDCEVKVLYISKNKVEPNEEAEKELSKCLVGITHDFNYRLNSDIPTGIYKFSYETNADIVTLVKRKGAGSLVDRLFNQSVSRRIAKHVRQTMLLFTD